MSKKIDLAFGNPSFMNDYWHSQDLPDASIYYPFPYMNEKQNPLLEEAIRKIHRVIGNVANVDDYSIVIGNGASQLLSAILYETPDVKVTAPIPYFLRFPVLAQIGDNMWSHKEQFKNIITAPNNPDGSWDGYDRYRFSSRKICPIIDACYNWPQYTTVNPLDEDVIIFSLSKATGHAGARLGWALIKNSELAKDVKRSVEMSTMGVSAVAQEVGRFVLNREASRYARIEENCFSYGRQVLKARWSKITELRVVSALPFEVLNNSSMFAWCEGEIPSHVEGILGDRFGDSRNKFRLNIGCSVTDFHNFIKIYEDEDDFDIPDSKTERIIEITDSEIETMMKGFVPDEG